MLYFVTPVSKCISSKCISWLSAKKTKAAQMLHLSRSDCSLKIIQCSHALCSNFHAKTSTEQKNYNFISTFLLRSSHHPGSKPTDNLLICGWKNRRKPGLCHYSKLLASRITSHPLCIHPVRKLNILMRQNWNTCGTVFHLFCYPPLPTPLPPSDRRLCNTCQIDLYCPWYSTTKASARDSSKASMRGQWK